MVSRKPLANQSQSSRITSAKEVIERVTKLGSKERAEISRRFFKTGPGEYGEGDVFLGITVPALRKLAREYHDLPLPQVIELIQSSLHEIRFLAVVILMDQFKRGDEKQRKAIFELYVKNIREHINNWDLVDVSAPHIVGVYLANKPKDVLAKLARSTSLWERRVAMLATFYDIRQGLPEEALKIAEILLHDRHDLMHKAVGWMLREIGKCCSPAILERFLKRHASTMPRTMLRYAIERLPKDQRAYFLSKKEHVTL